MDSNPYKPYLIKFFTSILDYRHTTERVSKVLLADAKKYEHDAAEYKSISALVTSDLSGSTENGVNLLHTGIFRETTKQEYSTEIANLISRECSYTFAQSFEAFERFLKDVLFYESTIDRNIRVRLEKCCCRGQNLTRETMRGGDKLLAVLNLVAGPALIDLFSRNSLGLRCKETFVAFSWARHAITHSKCIIDMREVSGSKLQLDTFKFLFDITECGAGFAEIRFEMPKYRWVLDRLCEYVYQLYKAICISHSLTYDLE